MPRETTRADKQTLIEQGTEFKGTMKSTVPVVVNGRIEGDLSAPELDVTATGVVQGNIKADRLSSRGTLAGNIDAGDLFLSGSISSKTVIKAKNLEVKLAPEQGRMELTIGECTLDVGDEPSKSRRLEGGSIKPAASASHLPVTRSEAPAPLLNKDDKATDLPNVPGLVPAGAADAKASGKEVTDGSKSVRAGASVASISKPPSKKTGPSDSVPPGPPGG
jgi:cytoskeletal protein CcmA (bactofilin family)